MEKLKTNDDILKEALKLVQALKQTKEYQEYLLSYQKILNNQFINNKIQNLKDLQKKYVKSAYLDQEIKEKMDKILKELENNQIYANYLKKQKQFNCIIDQITLGLNTIFEKILNNH